MGDCNMVISGSNESLGNLFNSVPGQLYNQQDYMRMLQGQQGNQWATNTVGFGSGLGANKFDLRQFLQEKRSVIDGVREACERIKEGLREEVVLDR